MTVALPAAAVLDTSALLSLVADDGDPSLRAAFLADRISLFVLDLTLYEVIDVLAGQLRRPANAIATDVDNLFDLDIPIVALDRALGAEAAWFAAEHDLAVGAAAVLAAARRLGVTVLTADAELASRVPAEQMVVLGRAP